MTSRLDPWPYSAKLSGVGLKLKPDPQTGVLISGTKVQPFASVAPQDYNYSTTPPYLERSYNFRRFVMGMGERAQQFAIVRRYFYADGVDCSINGMPMLGMAFTTVTPSNTGEVRGFVEALSGGTLKLFAICGRYVNVRNADTGVGWALSKDMGATGRVAQRFKDAGGTPKDCLYVTTDNNLLWQYDGTTDTTTWTNISTLVSATAADQQASYLELNNNLLVRSWDNKVSTCSSDPTVAANWSGTVFVGDSSQPITWLRVLGGTVFIFKTDGVYSIDSTGNPHSLFPALRVTPNVANGRNASVWGQTAWFRYGDGFYNMGPNTNGVIEMHPVGVERFIENDSPVRGYVTASEGWSNWFNFIALYNSELNTSYLLKYGSWFVDDQPPLGSSAYVRSSAIYNPISAGGSFFEPVLHGAIVSFPGKKITSMKVSSIPGPNERLYIGFSDGSISWGILPRGTPNPLADQNTAFQTSGTLTFGGHSMNFPGNIKSFRGITMMGPHIDNGDTVTVDYRLSPSRAKSVGELSPYTVAQMTVFKISALGSGEYNALGEFTQSGQRIDLILADGTVGAAGTEIDLRLTLASNGFSTPFIEGFALHEALRPDLLLTRDFVVEARDRMSRRDGSVDWRTAEQIRAVLQQTADAKGVVPMVMPDSQRINVEVVDYKEMMASEQTRSGNAWDIALSAVEFKSTIQFGSVGRLAGYTVADLKQFQVLQLGVI